MWFRNELSSLVEVSLYIHKNTDKKNSRSNLTKTSTIRWQNSVGFWVWGSQSGVYENYRLLRGNDALIIPTFGAACNRHWKQSHGIRRTYGGCHTLWSVAHRISMWGGGRGKANFVLYSCLLTYSMEHSPFWEAYWFSPSQEILRILWNPKVRHRIRKWPLSVPTLGHIDPVHNPTSHLLNIHLDITLPSTPGSSKYSLSIKFPHQNLVCTFPVTHIHSLPISFFSIWSPEKYWVSSTHH